MNRTPRLARSPAMPSLQLVAIVLLTASYGLLSCGRPVSPARHELSLTGLLGAPAAEGFARAAEPRPFSFPRDHGPHPEFRTEWWYFTGNLQAPEGRRFGFQLTFFRNSLAPPRPSARRSAWATNDAYMAHFAVTDVAGDRLLAFETFARGALGLAGARANPFRVSVSGWTAEQIDDDGSSIAADPRVGIPMRLRARRGPAGIDLRLVPERPPVPHGDDGLSRKGAERGNASYYYSFTRMDASGSLTIDGRTFEVSGLAWMDREWSTSALEQGQVGWDWFALQLDSGADLMLYRIRRDDGSTDRLSAGTLVTPSSPAGAHRVAALAAGDFRIDTLDSWSSPRGGEYPSGWRIRLADRSTDLVVEPLVRDQELDLSIRYWEGAVTVSGSQDGRAVSGRGYVELTGYAEPPAGSPASAAAREAANDR